MVYRRENAETLVEIVSLALKGVTANDKHRGIGAGKTFFKGQREKRRHVDARQTLEDEVFISEFFFRPRAGDLDVQRGSFPHRAERFAKRLEARVLIRFEILGRLHFFIVGDPLFARRVDLGEEFVVHHARRIVDESKLLDERFRRLLLLRARGRGNDEQRKDENYQRRRERPVGKSGKIAKSVKKRHKKYTPFLRLSIKSTIGNAGLSKIRRGVEILTKRKSDFKRPTRRFFGTRRLGLAKLEKRGKLFAPFAENSRRRVRFAVVEGAVPSL